jgi:hypothetical protein
MSDTRKGGGTPDSPPLFLFAVGELYACFAVGELYACHEGYTFVAKLSPPSGELREVDCV